MTADVELLPLPQWTQYNAHLRIRANSLQRRVQDYARAVAQHNVAARDAEIEALRAEVESERAARISAQEGYRQQKSQAEENHRE